MLNKDKVYLACAPIAWTNDDLPDLGAENTFEQCVSEMALAGFTGSEIGNKYPKDVETLKHKLDVRGMRICNAWFSSLLLSEGYDATIEAFIKHRDFLHALGAKVIGASEQGNSIQGKDVSIFGEKPVYTEEQWELIRKGFNKMGELAKEKGMYFTVHHHMGTGVQTAEEIDKLMEITDPDLVYLLFDTGHLSFSGEDVLGVLKKYVNRVKHVHLKSIRKDVIEDAKVKGYSFLDSVRAGSFTVPGDGDFDFTPVFDILDEAGYEGWVVVEAEQDPVKANPYEYAVLARNYIREKTGL
ncbi:MAG: myo-inosose-2 dehydratase [Clostridia bacterium]|nr:myo-inosose-2 dehydratase [Clostridia bacterium]MBR2417352.1 myo-inosose-2 dehydratase [Clostridia bacterium]